MAHIKFRTYFTLRLGYSLHIKALRHTLCSKDDFLCSHQGCEAGKLVARDLKLRWLRKSREGSFSSLLNFTNELK